MCTTTATRDAPALRLTHAPPGGRLSDPKSNPGGGLRHAFARLLTAIARTAALFTACPTTHAGFGPGALLTLPLNTGP